MKRLTLLIMSFAYCAFTIAAELPPEWAYAQNPPNTSVVSADNTIRHVPDSNISYSFAQVKDLFFTPDWHPQDHTALPEVVAHGRKPDVFACGFCHRADGPGGPENASLAGLPKDYIVQQMADFKSGKRKSAVPDRAPVTNMQRVASVINHSDVEAAAKYFSSLKPRKNIHVIETTLAPKTFERGWHLAKLENGETEPVGNRIVEVPETLANFISRDSHAIFVAYVPKGSIEKGKTISRRSDKSISCTECHGEYLRGKNAIPSLAGRSPSYIVRQLFDFKTGNRKSENMQAIAETLTTEDMIALAAYSASLAP